LRALLLQAFYTIRSNRQLMEQLHYEAELRQVSGIVERETGKDMVVRYSRAPSASP
jgi:transposase